MSKPRIDPLTGERIKEDLGTLFFTPTEVETKGRSIPADPPTIDPQTGERMPVEVLPSPGASAAIGTQLGRGANKIIQDLFDIPTSFAEGLGQMALGMGAMAAHNFIPGGMQKLAQDTANQITYAQPGEAPGIVAEQATGIPVPGIKQALKENRPGRAIGLTGAGIAGLGVSIPGAKAAAAKAKPTIPHLDPHLAMLNEVLGDLNKLDTANEIGKAQARTAQPTQPYTPPAEPYRTYAPSPEFVPVGEEPAYRRPSFPDASIAYEAGRGEMRQVARRPEPLAAPQIDPATGERVQVTPQAIDAPEGSQAPRQGILGNQVGEVGEGVGKGPIWFSRLERALPSWPESAHANKYLTLARSATSADELKWTGLDEFLGEAAKANRKLSRGEVEAYLKENKFEVEEVLLRDPNDVVPPSDFDPMALAHEHGGDPEDFRYVPEDSTKFHPGSGHSEPLSLPGGRKYRELLIKLPRDPRDSDNIMRESVGDLLTGRKRESQAYQSPHWPGQSNVLAHVRFNERTAPDGKKVLFIEEVQSDWHQAGREKGYRTGPIPGHVEILQQRRREWAEADARVATLRDRANQIATVQRGERGRADFLKDVIDFRPDQWSQRGTVNGTLLGEGDMAFLREYHKAVQDSYHAAGEVSRIERHAEQLGKGQVPDAPFKGNDWQKLVMRRMLRYAAEHGYDRVAWTTGLQQTQRYNDALGAALGERRLDWQYEPAPDHSALGPPSRATASDNITLFHPKTGETVWMGPASDLPGAVGSDLAKLIMADVEAGKPSLPGDHRHARYNVEMQDAVGDQEVWGVYGIDGRQHPEITGFFDTPEAAEHALEMAIARDSGKIDIKTGKTAIPETVSRGSGGMVQQYDLNLPNYLNKYTKGWGGKVQKGAIQTGQGEPVKPVGIPPGIWGTFRVLGEAAARERLAKSTSDKTVIDATIKEMQHALDLRNIPPAQQDVWSLDITPAMKASVMQGQQLGKVPLGPLLPMGAAAAGAVYGGTQGDTPEDRLHNALGYGLLGGAAAIGGIATRNVLRPAKRTPSAVSQLPRPLRQRLKQTTPIPGESFLAKLSNEWEQFKHETQNVFRSEHHLRAGGFPDVADRMLRYKSARLDIAAKGFTKLKEVLKGLETPEDYEDFWGLVAFKHDRNSILQGQGAEDNLTLTEVDMAINHIMANARPEVIQAADRHRQLMREIGDELVARGELHQSTVSKWGNYFPDFVLKHLIKTYKPDEIRLSAAQPIRPGRRGYLKERQGGHRETLRDYAKATLKYLTAVEDGHLKDDLVNDIVGDPTNPNGPGYAWKNNAGNPPADYAPFLYERGGMTYMVPKPIATRLKQWQDKPNYFVHLMDRSHALWKGLALRAVWGGFTAMNFLGDVSARYLLTPFWRWDDVTKSLANSALATADEMRGKQFPLSTKRGQNLAVAQMGKEEGLGTGAAVTDLGEFRRDPQLRKIQPRRTSLPGRAAQEAGDWVNSAFYRMDVLREYLENVPRLSEFMQHLEDGYAPSEAAKITRKVMIDYADLSPAEQHVFRGMLFPFYTFYKHNFARFTPGLATDSWKAALGQAQGLGLLALATAYNEGYLPFSPPPEIEKGLKPWERNQLHFNLPVSVNDDGSINYAVFMIADPLTIAASTVGLGGLPQRVTSLMKGRTDLADEWEESKRQMSWSLKGLVSPFIQAGSAALTGENFRTGQQLSPPEAGLQERVLNQLKHAAMLSPMNLSLRSSSAGPETINPLHPTTLGRELSSFGFGGLVRGGNTAEDQARKVYQAIGKATADRNTEAYQELRGPVADEYANKFQGMKQNEAAAFIEAEWFRFMNTDPARGPVLPLKYQDRQKAISIMAEGLKRASTENKKLQLLLHRLQIKRSNADKTEPTDSLAPHLIRELGKVNK